MFLVALDLSSNFPSENYPQFKISLSFTVFKVLNFVYDKSG